MAKQTPDLASFMVMVNAGFQHLILANRAGISLSQNHCVIVGRRHAVLVGKGEFPTENRIMNVFRPAPTIHA